MAINHKIEPKLAEVAAKTTAVLETLRTRLDREAASQDPQIAEPREMADELDRQLEQYFAAAAQGAPVGTPAEVRISTEIRAQVIDGVVDRILRSWSAPNGEIPASMKSEVIARLVEHVLGELLKKGPSPR